MFYLVPHVGHTWAVTQPKLFATVIRPFLTADLPAAIDDDSASPAAD